MLKKCNELYVHMKFENGIGHAERKESLLGCLDSLSIGPRRVLPRRNKAHSKPGKDIKKISLSLTHGCSVPESVT